LAINAKSSVLLLLLNNSSNVRTNIPGKLFELMGLAKPVIALGHEESDASFILMEAGFGACLAYDDKSAIRAQVISAYEAFKAGDLKKIGPRPGQFHRQELTRALATCLDSMM
jgi:hypothetical protein